MITLKKITALLLLFPSFYSMADEANLKKMIEASYPKYKVESIKKTSYSGLYEVFMGGQIIYTDEKFSFLIAEGRKPPTRGLDPAIRAAPQWQRHRAVVGQPFPNCRRWRWHQRQRRSGPPPNWPNPWRARVSSCGRAVPATPGCRG